MRCLRPPKAVGSELFYKDSFLVVAHVVNFAYTHRSQGSSEPFSTSSNLVARTTLEWLSHDVAIKVTNVAQKMRFGGDGLSISDGIATYIVNNGKNILYEF